MRTSGAGEARELAGPAREAEAGVFRAAAGRASGALMRTAMALFTECGVRCSVYVCTILTRALIHETAASHTQTETQ